MPGVSANKGQRLTRPLIRKGKPNAARARKAAALNTPRRGTLEIAGKSRAARLMAERMASMDSTPRTCASLRSRACFLASSSSSVANSAGGRGGKPRDEAEPRTWDAGIFFSTDINLYSGWETTALQALV